ncbi:hypothetical protein HDU81_004208 [Chytriomyces hyalinus]|nr:hypothetical protein HDU81_004208 [Chytriomyces hyalinus]
MLDEVNSYRKLLQMPLLTRIESSFLTLSKTPAPTAVCPSIDTVPSISALSSRRTLESMPAEILDRIPSYVSGDDILQLCHAVRYFKYISKAMFDFGCALPRDNPRRLVHFNFWPCVYLRQPPAPEPFEQTLPVPISHLYALQKYSAILSKHGGYASIDDSTGLAMLGALPESIELFVNHAKLTDGMDEFFAAVNFAKSNMRELTLGLDYFERCNSDPASLDMTAKWLVKLPIRELRFLSPFSIPTAILGVLHLAPMLTSLRLPSLKDCAGISLSECKSLRKLFLSKLFVGEENAEELVQKVLNVVKATKIRELAICLPYSFQTYLRNDLRGFVAALFLRNGWYELRDGLDRYSGSTVMSVGRHLV